METKPFVIIEPRKGLSGIDWRELWDYRELLYFLIWRDILVRYKQTVLGALWEIVKPLSLMIIYTLCLGIVLKVPTGGVPYPLFYYTGLLVWGFFSQAVIAATPSMINSANIVNKIFFPRIVIPTGTVLSGLFDLAIASVMQLLLMIYYGVAPTLNLLFLPMVILVTIITALGVGFLFSAITVKYRDFQNLMSVLVLLWMFISPLMYPVTLIPERWILLYSFNPMTAAIEGFRWAVLGKTDLAWWLFLPGISSALIIFAIGLIYFQIKEKSFSDWL